MVNAGATYCGGIGERMGRLCGIDGYPDIAETSSRWSMWR
jgi:hypothetical protein